MDLDEKVEKIYLDLYIGEGKSNPGLMTRTTLLEDNLDKINKNLSKMVWLLVGIFLTI